MSNSTGIKLNSKGSAGVMSTQLASYLDEYMYREWYGQTARQWFDSIIGDIAN